MSSTILAYENAYDIVPDIQAFNNNLPTEHQWVNVSDTTLAAEAFFEIKSYSLPK
jgi:hypothetical protein